MADQRPVDILFPQAERPQSIEQRLCVKVPFGCGQPIGDFADSLSVREYQISGLCQKCQDRVFAEPERDIYGREES